MTSLADLLRIFVPFGIPAHLTSWIHGQSILSTNEAVVAALISYLAVISGIQALMKDQKPYNLTSLFRVHNAVLSSGSLLLLALMMEEIGPFIWKHGLYAGVCAEAAWTPRMELYYMINYYFKYLEFLDTVFLAFKKKPMQFLHVFHHSATAFLCYTQLEGRTSNSWPIISLNLAVHVIMYYYYYATAGGAKFWWKKHLTSMQIAQFVVDVVGLYFATYSGLAAKYFPSYPNMGPCAGSDASRIFGCVLLTSYLGLFINFYIQTYKTRAVLPAPQKPDGKTKGNGQIAH